MYQWFKRKKTGTCPRYCRYTDEEMLKPEVSSGFMASAAAVLATDLPNLVDNCDYLDSLSCLNQLAEIGSLMGFVGRALNKARALAKEGKVSECQKLLPESLAGTLGESMAQFLSFMKRATSGNSSKLEKQVGALPNVQKQETIIRGSFNSARFTQLCTDSKSVEREEKVIHSMSEEEMKSLLVKASKGALNPEKAEPLVREIKSKGVEALTEDLLNQEEKAIEKEMQKADEEASLMALKSESRALSLAEGARHEMQLRGQWDPIGGMGLLLMSLFMRIFMSIFAAPFFSLFCIISLGKLTDETVHNKFQTYQRVFAPVTCPFMVYRWMWGMGNVRWGEDFFSNSHFSWGFVAETFYDPDPW